MSPVLLRKPRERDGTGRSKAVSVTLTPTNPITAKLGVRRDVDRLYQGSSGEAVE